jgi:PEP-CTERM motif-containing protein
MKRTIVLAVLALAGTITASAGTLSFASGDGINEFNFHAGSFNSNVNIGVNPAWEQNHPGAGSWVSYADTGSPGTVTPKNVVAFPLLPTALFFEYFTLENAQIISTILNVWADDTAGVAVNNHIVKVPNGVQDGACAGGAIGCEPGEGLHIDIAPYLKIGENVLTFGVYQRDGGPFGLLYDGKILTAGQPAETPEPATMGLMGSAMAALGMIVRKRKSTGC